MKKEVVGVRWEMGLVAEESASWIESNFKLSVRRTPRSALKVDPRFSLRNYLVVSYAVRGR